MIGAEEKMPLMGGGQYRTPGNGSVTTSAAPAGTWQRVAWIADGEQIGDW